MNLEQGQVAVWRTDTLYGLVARAGDREAVEKVYALKGRDFTKPCIVLIASLEAIGEYGPLVQEISSQYEGAVTVVVPKTTEPDWITRGGETVAYRIPKDDRALAVLEETGPLIAPSANPQGENPAKSIEEAKRYFEELVDIYVDDGEVDEQAQASKIVTAQNNGTIDVLRV